MMRRNIRGQFLTIITLLIIMIGMTIGFAAFSNTLTISSSANVKPDSESFKVVVSGSETDTNVTDVSPIITGDATGSIAKIEDNSITNLSVCFTEPGQSVSYVGYLHNVGEYVAYSRKIIFNNISGENVKKKCVAGEGATESLVSAACNAISLTYVAEIPRYSPLKAMITDTLENSTSYNDIQVGEYAVGTVIISYDEAGARADGPFTVLFGDIELEFNSSNE